MGTLVLRGAAIQDQERGELGITARMSDSLGIIRAPPLLKGRIDRGIAIVRDAGGAVWSLAQATETNLVPGPRIPPPHPQDELRAAVAEADAWQTYLMANAYTPKAIRRAIEAGVRTTEHGNLVDEEVARIIKSAGAFVVPTLVTYDMLSSEGAQLGLPPESIADLLVLRGQPAQGHQRAAGTGRGNGRHHQGRQLAQERTGLAINGRFGWIRANTKNPISRPLARYRSFDCLSIHVVEGL